MVEVYLVITGLVFFGWLYALVRQTQQGLEAEQANTARPVVPVNLMDSDEAVVVAEGRGRIIFANDRARDWFGINGGSPNLSLMAQMVQPNDTLHDLFADAGHASFRLGQRRIEAVSHVIPGPEGQRMIVVMREMTAAALQAYTDFDPLHAMAILSDISQVIGTGLDLETIVDAVLRSLKQSRAFDSAEIMLWQPETQTLRPVIRERTPTGSLRPPGETQDVVHQLGEGYSGWVAMYRQPLLITDVASRTDVFPKVTRFGFQSYVGVPLVVADRFIGTLELSSRERNAFGQRHVALLQTVAGQVAAGLEAARLYQDQTNRVAELSGLQQIAEAMSQLGELSELYSQLTSRIAHLMDVEVCGVLLFNEDKQTFRSQPPFYGVPDHLIQDYRLTVLPDTEMYSIWRHQPWWYTNDPDSSVVRALGLNDLISAFTLNSLALAPMLVGARRVGLLLIANKRNRKDFNEGDMRVLMSFASQAGVVAENARLYNEEQRRNQELGGLQQIAQAMGVMRSPEELYAQVTARIAELMNVQMCGVLLFDPKTRVLVSQRPFYGMDDEESISFYQIPSPLDGLVARLWLERDTWFTNDVRHDPLVADTDLARLASVVGINQTVIAALVVGGNRLGIIQASNKLDGTDFTEDDARLMSIFAGQAAILVDNTRLYREMQRRTHEAEGLRAITEIASQPIGIQEAMEQVIIAIANLLESHIISVALVDEQTGQLVIEPNHIWGISIQAPYKIDAYAPGFEQSVLISRRPFASNSLRDDRRMLPEYRTLVDTFNLYNMVQVPLVIQDRSIGELTAANKTTGEGYTNNDVQLLTAIAIQVAAMIDRMRLYEATDQDLRARLQELDALSRVSHELSQTLELDRILDVIRHEAMRSTNAGAATVVLLSDREDWADTTQPLIDRRFGESRTLPVLVPVEWAAIAQNEAVCVNDYAESDYTPVPEEAHSALVVPVTFGNQAVGLIHLYSEQTGIFDQRVIDFVSALTDQAAVAIGNARRYHDQLEANQQLRIRTERMGRIFQLGELFRQGVSLPDMLEEVANSVQETVGFNVVLISLLDTRTSVMRRTAQAGLPLAVFEEMQAIAPPLAQAQSLMRDEYRISNSYFLPAEGASDITSDLPIYQSVKTRMGPGARSWDPQDLLIVPLYGSGGRLLGIVTVDEPRSGRRPDLATVEALEIFANQASFSIENYRLIERIQREAEATRRERDRLAQLHMVASEIQSAPDVPSRLQVVADGIHDAGWGRVVITLRDQHLEPTALIHAGYSAEEALLLSDEVVPGSVWRTWINDLSFYDLRIGAGYYLRYDHPWVQEHVLQGETPDPASVPDDVWHPQDVLYLPLVGQDQKRIIGMIEMYDPAENRLPTDASLQPFELFASQAAAAIETTRLYLETVRAAEQEQRLNEMMEVVSSSLDSQEVIKAIGYGLQQMVPFTRMSVALYDEGTGRFETLRADITPGGSMEVVGDRSLKVEQTATGDIFRSQTAQLYHLKQDETTRAAFTDLQGWYDSGERSTLVLPMIAGGQTIGVLHLGSELENAFGFRENQALIQRLANLSAVALDNARLFQQAREREAFSADMYRASQSLNQILDLGSVLRTICAESVPTLGVDGAYALLVVGSDLIGIAASGPAQEEFVGISIPTSDLDKLVARVVAERRPIYINDLQTRDDLDKVIALTALHHIHAVLAVPLLREDQVLGVLALIEEDEDQRFDNLDVQQASAFAVQAALAIENARLFEESEQRASQLDAQARRLALINRVAIRLAQSLNATDIYLIALQEMQEILGAQFSGLILYESETTGRLVLDTKPGAVSKGDLTIGLEDTAIEQVRQTHKPVAADEVLHDPRFEQTWDVLAERGTQSLMVVPLILRDRVVGTIGLDFTSRHIFSPAEIELAETIASQVSVALDKAQLLDEAEQRARELDEQARRLSVINRISAKLAQTLDPQEIYQIILTDLQNALGVQSSGLMLLQDDDTSRLVLSTHPMDSNELSDIVIPVRGNPVAEYILQTQQPFVSEDLLNDVRFKPMWDLQRARNTAAMLIIPVIMGEQVIGTIGLDSSRPRVFTDTEIELAMTMANQAAIAIEKARLFNEAHHRAAELNAQAQRLALINRISGRLAQTLDPEEIYAIVLGELVETLGVQFGGLVIFESETTGRLVLDYPFDHPTPDLTLDLTDNESIDIVRRTHKPLTSADVLNDPVFRPAWDNLRARGTKALMIVPLVASEQVLGTIGLDSTVSRVFTESEMEMAETIASQASLAIEKARLYNETLALTIFNQAVVESIQQGIVVLDRNLEVRRVNRFLIERYGWTSEAIGRQLFDYRPDYGKFLRQQVAVALGMGEPQVNYDIEQLTGSGEQSICNFYVYPMREGRNVTGIVILVEDVTERSKLEADVNARAIQMAALSEVSSQITATLEPDQVINLVLDALARVIPYDGVSLWLRSPTRDELDIVAARGYQDPDSPKAEELIGLTVEIPYSPIFREMSENAKVINVGDIGAGDPRFPYGAAAIYKNWLGAPLISKGNVVGVLALEKRDPNFYTPLHELLTSTFANQAAIALDNAQLFHETRSRASALDEQAQRLALLNRVSLALAQSLDLENIFEIALRETAIALGVNEGLALQFDQENQMGRAIVEYPRGDEPPQQIYDLSSNQAIDRVLRGLIPLVIENVESDPHTADLRAMMRREDVASTLIVPLVVGGNVIGMLRLDAIGEPRQFSLAQIELAQTIASQAAIAVQNAALFEQTSIRTRELETLFESAQATAVTLDLNEVARRVTMQMLSAIQADACTVFLWDDVSNRLEVRGDISARPADTLTIQPGDMYPLADYPLREQALRDRELIIMRIDETNLPPGEIELMEQHRAASRMLIPLVVNEISIGLVEVETLDPNRLFKTEDVRLARTLASQAAISIENARLQTETRRTVEELYIINDMSAALSSAVNLKQLLEVVADQLPNLTEAHVIYVALYDSPTSTISYPLAVREDVPFEIESHPLGPDEFSMIIRRQTPLLLAGENMPDVRRILGIQTVAPDAACFLGVPLFAADEVIGALGVQDNKDPMAFSHNDQRILTTVASQLGVAIQSARLFQQTLQQAEVLDQRVRERTAELEQERQHISTLYQITTELATSLDMDRLLNRSLTMVAQAVGATQGMILAMEPSSEQLRSRAHFGWPRSLDGDVSIQEPNQGLAQWAVQERESLIVDDVQLDPRWLHLSEVDDLPRAAMVVLIEATTDILGVMMLFSETPGAFEPDHLRLVTAAASQVANAMNNAELYTLIRDQAERLGLMLRQEQVEATKSAAILDSVADGVMVADAEGQVILFNPTAGRILRVPAERVLNRPMTAMTGLYGTSASRWAETIDLWMEQPGDYQPGDFVEDRIVLEDERVISVRLSPVIMGEQFLGSVSIFRDITREVEVDRLKSEFVATVSHELRTPMTSIKGYADLLLLGAAGEITEQQQRFLETIKQNADRLSVLVNDLLDISRIDQGRVELRFAPMNMVDLIHSVAEHLEGRSKDEKRPMNITIDLPDDQPLTVWGDYDKVIQIVSNLADNAFNYTLPDGHITLSAAQNGDHLIVSVADTGIGIPPDLEDRIFERFFRGDEVHELVMDTPGTGLGLAIVREFVQMHNGRIWYESEVGKGTTFYVELPSRASEAVPSSLKPVESTGSDR